MNIKGQLTCLNYNGKLTIPKEHRMRLGLKAEDTLDVYVQDDEVRIRKVSEKDVKECKRKEMIEFMSEITDKEFNASIGEIFLNRAKRG